MEVGLKRRALLVLGMHRSGTSAFARVLSLRGASLPHNLLPANAGNRGGYWEPARIVELNDRILAAYGLAWDVPFAMARLPAADAFPAHFVEEARQLVLEEYGDAGLLVLKDPRCTLLEGFWSAVLESLGIAVSPVVMVRPWQEVVASLVQRDASSAVGAAMLYIAYGAASAQACAGKRSYVVYEDLVKDWRAVTDRIAAEQGFRWPQADAQAAAEIEAYLQPASRAPATVELPEHIATWADATWHWLRDAAHSQERPASELAAIGARLSEQLAPLAPLLLDKNHRLQELQRVRTAERDEALRIYRATDALLQQANADHALLQQQHDATIAERDEALRIYRATDALLQQAHADHESLQQQHDATIAERDEALRIYRDTDALLQQAHADHETLQQQHERTLAERDEVLRIYRDTDALLQQAHVDYRNLDYANLDLQASLAATRSDLARLQQELALTLGSRSWRMTAPLRRAARLARRALGRESASTAPVPASLAPAVVPVESSPIPEAVAVQADPAVHDAIHRRPHPELRAFLVDEFGEAAADDVLLRIDRYRLPIQSQDVRSAAKIECTAGQAAAWVERIAALAPQVEREGAPDVSIVLPVYNQLPFTLACVDALLCHRTRYTFEILVGDDASSDATGAALAHPIAGVRHVRHASNLGFVRNCNVTAAHARGRHVLFLNNDTQVLPGWLDELIGTLDADPAIGMAGSKLIFPDGRLQECGAIVWRDGSAWNYGRLADPRRPEFCYLRDVDYVSGASIALRRELWEELGGFDELFVPAYAEDADLAFRIRARGLRTVVQPLSQLLHFEGISSGTDVGTGAKAYQVENLRKLHARWQDVLATHRANADSPELEKERSVGRRVLFIDHCTPTPREDAGSLVAMEIMQGFIANGCKVTFIPEDNFAHMGADTRALQRQGIEAIYHPAYSRMPAFLAARSDPFDLVFLHRFGVGDAHMAALRRKYPQAKFVFLNADMHHLRELREAEVTGDAGMRAQALRTRERELRVVGQADVALVHSEFEFDLLRRELPQTQAVLFPLIHDPVDAVAPLAARNGVCFVGGFRHPPNADGIAWFVEESWPLVLAQQPDAKLYVVGSHMTPQVRALGAHRGVEIVGFVEDLAAFLDRRRVSVAPLRYGAGAKGKVAESLAHGLPMVCTPVAAEGMQLTPGENVLVGDDASSLARHVATLLADDDAWLRQSRSGLDYARELTSRASAHARLKQILER
jgi:GT2 family glycosyltransferase